MPESSLPKSRSSSHAILPVRGTLRDEQDLGPTLTQLAILLTQRDQAPTPCQSSLLSSLSLLLWIVSLVSR